MKGRLSDVCAGCRKSIPGGRNSVSKDLEMGDLRAGVGLRTQVGDHRTSPWVFRSRSGSEHVQERSEEWSQWELWVTCWNSKDEDQETSGR